MEDWWCGQTLNIIGDDIFSSPQIMFVSVILWIEQMDLAIGQDLLIQNQTALFQNVREQPTYIDFKIMKCLLDKS